MLIDFVDAKPLWAALYQSLNPMNTEDYEHRRLSIHEISSRCNGLTMRNKRLISDDLVAREGVEPPTPAFSAVFSEPKPFFNQQLNPSRWPNYCDHSVTSADVRLSVGNTHRETVATIFDALGF